MDKIRLSKPQLRALRHLYHKNEWANDTPVTQKCLNVLSEKGLVRVAHSPEMGWIEKITLKGRLAYEMKMIGGG